MFKQLYSNQKRRRGLLAIAALCLATSMSAQSPIPTVDEGIGKATESAVLKQAAPASTSAVKQNAAAPKGKIKINSLKDILGTYMFGYTPEDNLTDWPPRVQSVTISQLGTYPDSVLIKPFYWSDTEVHAKVDLDKGQLIIPVQHVVTMSDGTIVYFAKFSATGYYSSITGGVTFNIQEDGSFTVADNEGWGMMKMEGGKITGSGYMFSKGSTGATYDPYRNCFYKPNGRFLYTNGASRYYQNLYITQDEYTVSALGFNFGKHPVRFDLKEDRTSYVDSTDNYCSLVRSGNTSSGNPQIVGAHYFLVRYLNGSTTPTNVYSTDPAPEDNENNILLNGDVGFYAWRGAKNATSGAFLNLNGGKYTNGSVEWTNGKFVYPSVQAEADSITIDGLTYKILSKEEKTAGVIAHEVVTEAIIKGQVTIGNVEYTVTEMLENCFKSSTSKLTGKVYIPKTIKKFNTGVWYSTTKISEIEIEDPTALFLADYVAPTSSPTANYSKALVYKGEPLTDFTYPDTITIMKQYGIYYNRGMKTLGLPKNLKILQQYSLYGLDNVKPLNLDASKLEYIGNRALYHANIDTFTVSSTVKTMEDYALAYMNRTKKIIFENDLQIVPDYLCYYTSEMEEIVLPKNMKRVGKYAFGTTKLKNIVVPDVTTFIGEQAFSNATGLETLIIGAKVDTIGSRAFYSTAATSVLKSVTIRAKTPPVTLPYATTGAIETFSTPQYAATLYVPIGTKATYSAIEPWKNFNEIIEIDTESLDKEITQGDLTYTIISVENKTASVKAANKTLTTADIAATIKNNNEDYKVIAIADNGFENCTKLTTINIPASITESGKTPFTGCTALNKVNAADLKAFAAINYVDSTSNPLYYGKNLYVNNAATTTLTLPEDLTAVAPYAFYGAQNVTKIATSGKLTSIGNYAFAKTGISSLTFTDTKATLGNGVFAYSPNLVSVEIADAMSKVGNNMFQYCPKLKDVTFAEEVTEIGTGAFYGCGSLVTINLPVYAKTIGESAFAYCQNLEEIVISVDVSSIGKYAFYSPGTTTKIKNVKVKAKTPPTCVAESDGSYTTFNDAVYKSATLTVSTGYADAYKAANVWKNFSTIKEGNLNDVEDKVFTNGNYTYTLVSSEDATVTVAAASNTITMANDIPEQATNVDFGKTYTVIGFTANGFKDCAALQEVTIPSTVTTFGAAAFQGCSSLTKVTVKDLAKWCEIDFPSEYANPVNYAQKMFVDGKLLTTLVVPEGVKKIGSYSFYDNKMLLEATFPESLETIGRSAFRYCTRLDQVNFSDNIKSVANYAFSACGLVDVECPDNMTIGQYAFESNTNLKSFKIPKNLKILDIATFWGCENLTDITWGEALVATSQSCLCFTGLTKAELPETVDSIGVYTFYRGEKLTEVVVSKNVRVIGVCAFYANVNTNGIKKVTSYATTPPACFDGFGGRGMWFHDNVYNNATLYIPKGTKAAYAAAEEWKNFKHVEEVDFDAGVENVTNDEGYRIENGNIILPGDSEVQIYTIDGKMLFNGKASSYQLGDKGIYIMVLNGKAYKIAF